MKAIKKLLVFMFIAVLGVSLAACKNKKAEFDKAVANFSLPINSKKTVKGNFKVPTEGASGIKATWTSSNPDLILVGTEKDENGNITLIVNNPKKEESETKPEPEVKITVKLTKGKYSATKEWTLKVGYVIKAKLYTIAQALDPANKAEIEALATAGTPVAFENVVVAGVALDQFDIANADGNRLAVYCGKEKVPTNVKQGLKGNLEAVKFAMYCGTIQLSSLSKDAEVKFTPSGTDDKFSEIKQTDITISEISALIEGKIEAEIDVIKNDPNKVKVYKLRGKVKILPANAEKYKVVLVDPADDTKMVPVRYTYSEAYEKMLETETVVYNVVGTISDIRYSDDKFGNVPTTRLAVYKFDAEPITPEQQANIDIAKFKKTLTVEQQVLKVDDPLLLPAGTNGVTATYAFKDATNPSNARLDLVNKKTLSVPGPTEEGEVVVITATLEKALGTTVVVDITVAVGKLVPTPVEDALALPAGTSVYVEVKILELNGKNAVLTDTANAEFIIGGRDNNSWPSCSVGDVIGVKGQISIYKGLVQVKPEKITKLTKTIDVTEEEVTYTNALFNDPKTQLRKFNAVNMTILSMNGLDMVLLDEAGNEVNGRGDVGTGFVEGNKVNVKSARRGMYNAPQFILTADNLELATDQTMADLIKEKYVLSKISVFQPNQSVTGTGSVPISVAIPGNGAVAITWTVGGTNPTAISINAADGSYTVTQTTAAQSATLTGKFTIGGVEKTYTVTVTIPAQ